MDNISKIDKNFIVQTSFDTSGMNIYNVLEEPFKIYGLIPPNGENDTFKRIPTEVAKTVSEGVFFLHDCCAGGRVRFRTNSPSVAIFVEYDPNHIDKAPHFPLTGTAGLDMYIDNKYAKTFIPPYDVSSSYSSLYQSSDTSEKEIIINLPLYSAVRELYIGLDKNATLTEPTPYAYDKPIVFYGSSITQGGCASRPGTGYEAIISRRFNCDFINLGFSGNAKAEDEIAEYISKLDMKIFVYDYDHNAPSIGHLEKTHKKMFDIIRAKNPTVPIIMLSRPACYADDNVKKRWEIIQRTYETAVANGDKNVYFINGHKMINEFADDSASVDGTHPNDYGFAAMAKGIGNVIEKLL